MADRIFPNRFQEDPLDSDLVFQGIDWDNFNQRLAEAKDDKGNKVPVELMNALHDANEEAFDGIAKHGKDTDKKSGSMYAEDNDDDAEASMEHKSGYMKEAKKGLIINIPGVLGKVPMAGAAAYSASKYGIVGMMQSIREEVKRTEIRITNLFLGGVDSPFWDTIDLRVQKDKMIVAEEAARAIWFLCQQPRSGVVSEMVLQPFNHQAI